MKQQFIISVAAGSIWLALAGAAQAESMRCGDQIISGGQIHPIDKYEVLKRCGEPTERNGNTWVYEKPGEIRRTLYFNAEGQLDSIEED